MAVVAAGIYLPRLAILTRGLANIASIVVTVVNNICIHRSTFFPARGSFISPSGVEPNGISAILRQIECPKLSAIIKKHHEKCKF